MKSITESTESYERSENFSIQSSFRSCKFILELIEGETNAEKEPERTTIDLKDDDKFSFCILGEGEAEKLS